MQFYADFCRLAEHLAVFYANFLDLLDVSRISRSKMTNSTVTDSKCTMFNQSFGYLWAERYLFPFPLVGFLEKNSHQSRKQSTYFSNYFYQYYGTLKNHLKLVVLVKYQNSKA